jgi:hypothetical protein
MLYTIAVILIVLWILGLVTLVPPGRMSAAPRRITPKLEQWFTSSPGPSR